jgi:hypothetical protein
MKTFSKLLMLFVALSLFSCGGASDEKNKGADSTVTQSITEENGLKLKGFYGGMLANEKSKVIYILHLWEIKGKIVGRIYNTVYDGKEVMQSDTRCFIDNARMEGNKITFTGNLVKPFNFEGVLSGKTITADISYPGDEDKGSKAFQLTECCKEDKYHKDFADEETWIRFFQELDKPKQ